MYRVLRCNDILAECQLQPLRRWRPKERSHDVDRCNRVVRLRIRGFVNNGVFLLVGTDKDNGLCHNSCLFGDKHPGLVRDEEREDFAVDCMVNGVLPIETLADAAASVLNLFPTWWRALGRRPDNHVLAAILCKNITEFAVNPLVVDLDSLRICEGYSLHNLWRRTICVEGGILCLGVVEDIAC